MVRKHENGQYSVTDVNGVEFQISFNDVITLSRYYDRECHENDIRAMLEGKLEDGELDKNQLPPPVIEAILEDVVDRYEEYLEHADDDTWVYCADNAIRDTIAEKFENKGKDKPLIKDER